MIKEYIFKKEMIKSFDKYILEGFQNDFLDLVVGNLGLKIKNIIMLGKGMYGRCYELNNNKVIKFFVEEESKVYNSICQRDIKLPNLVKIYEVGKVKLSYKKWYVDFYKMLSRDKYLKDIYFIIEEKLFVDKTLTDKITYFNDLYGRNSEYNFLEDIIKYQYNDPYNLDEDIEEIENRLSIVEDKLTIEEKATYDTLHEIYRDCAKNEIICTDYNPVNFAYDRSGKIKMFDLMDANEYNLKIYEYNDKQLDKII